MTQTSIPRTRIALRAATVALIAVVISMFAATGSASASQNNMELDAYCQSNHSIQAWAPDLTHEDSRLGIAWSPRLMRFNGTSWVRFLDGPTQWESGGAWITQSVTFSGLPTGYYQVVDSYVWAWNGVRSGSYVYFQPVRHKLDGVSYYYGSSLPTKLYSTASYCYMS